MKIEQRIAELKAKWVIRGIWIWEKWELDRLEAELAKQQMIKALLSTKQGE